MIAQAGSAHKFQVFDFRFAWKGEFFSRSYSFWAGLIGGCFLTTASHGTEQLLVQRLSRPGPREKAVPPSVSSWVVIFFQFGLFLFIGCCYLCIFRQRIARAPAARPIYPEVRLG